MVVMMTKSRNFNKQASLCKTNNKGVVRVPTIVLVKTNAELILRSPVEERGMNKRIRTAWPHEDYEVDLELKILIKLMLLFKFARTNTSTENRGTMWNPTINFGNNCITH